MPKIKRLGYLFSFKTIRFLQPFWDNAERNIVAEILGGARFDNHVKKLERKIRDLTGVNYSFGVNLGRSAIQIALEAFDFPKGAEVILPAFACGGVCVPVIKAGLTPVFTDIDRDFNIKAKSVYENLSPQTKAVIVPHLSGKWNQDMFRILDIARDNGMKVIEDTCQAFGLEYENKWAGTFGDVGIFSFGQGKQLFVPNGGMLITNNKKVIDYCEHRALAPENQFEYRRKLRSFLWNYNTLSAAIYPAKVVSGLIKSRFRRIFGGNIKGNWLDVMPDYPLCRMSNQGAALILEQFKKYQRINEQRKQNAKTLLTSDLNKIPNIILPCPNGHVFTKFLISFTGDQKENQSINLRRFLTSYAIEIESSYTPLYHRKPFACFRKSTMENTEQLWHYTFSLPIRPNLTQRQVNRICSVIKRYTHRCTEKS